MHEEGSGECAAVQGKVRTECLPEGCVGYVVTGIVFADTHVSLFQSSAHSLRTSACAPAH